MAIGQEGRVRARKDAPYHVQLELENNQEVQGLPVQTQVEGRVIRVFRSDGRLVSGDHVTFDIWLCQKGDEPTGPAYIYYEQFLRASHMEVYLLGDPPECTLMEGLTLPTAAEAT